MGKKPKKNYDLVFVVAVSQLAHNLHDDVTLSGFFGFVVLFLPLWWSWIGSAMCANRFDSDDVGHRLLNGLQMLAGAALAINIILFIFLINSSQNINI